MVTLMIGTFAVAGIGLGWYGHKVSLRIESWGRRADECDLIFQQMSGREDACEIEVGSNRRLGNSSGGASLVNPHFPVAAAASK